MLMVLSVPLLRENLNQKWMWSPQLAAWEVLRASNQTFWCFLLFSGRWIQWPQLHSFDHIIRRLGLKTRLHWEFLERCERLLFSVITDSRFLCYLPPTLATESMLHITTEWATTLGGLSVSDWDTPTTDIQNEDCPASPGFKAFSYGTAWWI